MVYNRVRNSRYASYSRACNSRGLRAQFSIPMRGTANFSPWIDGLNHLVNSGGDMLSGPVMDNIAGAVKGVGQSFAGGANPYASVNDAASAAMRAATQNLSPENAANALKSGVSYGQDFFENARDGIMGAVRGAGQYFTDNPMAANVAKGAGGVAGIAGGATAAAKAVDKFGRPVAQAAEEVAPAAIGLRQRAGAMLKNPYALAAGGAGVLGAGAYGANQMMNQDK